MPEIVGTASPKSDLVLGRFLLYGRGPCHGVRLRQGVEGSATRPMVRRAPSPREMDLAAVRTAGPRSRGSAFSCGTTTESAAAIRSSAPKIGAATLTSGCG